MTTHHLTVPGLPIPQPRQRVAIRAGHAATYTPTRHPVNAFKAAVRLAWLDQCPTVAPTSGPVRLTAWFFLPKPAGRTKKRDAGKRMYVTCKPDLDNLAKSLLDALAGLAWRDDAQVADLIVSKAYCVTDAAGAAIEGPRVDVAITELEV